jgi:hypothetical protein
VDGGFTSCGPPGTGSAGTGRAESPTIHGIKEHDGIRALALELVEGDTLADPILAGPMAVPEAVAIAR